MKMDDIDPAVKLVAALKRREMEVKYLGVQLKRSKEGIPVAPGWARHWAQLIDAAVAKEVAQYQANRNLNIEPPYCQPVAFKNLPPATQVAQALNAAARRSKSV